MTDPATGPAPGPAPLTHRRVLKGVVDTGVVGQIPAAEPIAAVGVGAVILSAVYWIFGFLRMGTTGLTAQAAGQGDSAEVAALLTRGLMIGLAAGVMFILLQPLLYPLAFAVSTAATLVNAVRYVQRKNAAAKEPAKKAD